MANKDAYTLFIVDDDTKTLTITKHFLEKNSEYRLNIHTFATGEDCLNKLELNPQVIILDYYFDAIDPTAKNGIDILKQIKEDKPSTHVIMLSGQDDMEVALETIRNGAEDYVIKNNSSAIRLQLSVDKILDSINKEQLLKEYKRGIRITIGVMIVFIIVMVTFIVIATME